MHAEGFLRGGRDSQVWWPKRGVRKTFEGRPRAQMGVGGAARLAGARRCPAKYGVLNHTCGRGTGCHRARNGGKVHGLKSGKQPPLSCQFQKALAIRNGGMHRHHSEAVINIPAAPLVKIANPQLST